MKLLLRSTRSVLALLPALFLAAGIASGGCGTDPDGTSSGATSEGTGSGAPADGAGGGEGEVGAAAEADAAGQRESDVEEPGEPETGEPDASDADPEGDATVPVGPSEEGTPTFRAYVEVPVKSVLPEELEACSVIAEEACVEGSLWTCELWDPAGAAGSGAWAEAIPPMTEQAYWFDRFYDLYHEANGQSMDIHFAEPALAGTPEEEWSSPDYFERYGGYGDSSGWTGTALWGAASRFAATGTQADYERMLAKVESMAFMYEVTGVEGLLARSHWGMLEEGAPHPHGLWGLALAGYDVGDGSDGHFLYPIAPELWDRLPDYYQGEVEIGGEVFATTPTVQGDASRDMYVRSLPGVLLALDLLGEGEREEAVRATLLEELPCTINRMKKGRIQNLQQAPDIQEAVTSFFAGDNLLLDEGDLDFTALDELIFFVLEQPHPLHLDAFDFECPDSPPFEVDPELDLDAADPLFLLDLIELAQREQRQGEVPIQFSMHVSIRGSDTLFMTQWALTAHSQTGDPVYLEWLEALMAEIDYWGALRTYGALQLPRWCAPHFGPSIGYPSLYNVLARVDPAEHPDYWSLMSEVAVSEGWDKDNGPREDAFWGILYHRMATTESDPEVDTKVATAVELLGTYGMNPDDKLEPDRSYPRDWVTNPHPDAVLEEIEPGDPEWAICEEPMEVFGIEVPAAGIDGIPIRSVDPLPLPMRIGGTLLWQMDPWMVQRTYGGVGMHRQWPMIGLTTPYWIGRAEGLIEEGAGLALAWRETGEECP